MAPLGCQRGRIRGVCVSVLVLVADVQADGETRQVMREDLIILGILAFLWGVLMIVAIVIEWREQEEYDQEERVLATSGRREGGQDEI
jgi:hypothetical protein